MDLAASDTGLESDPGSLQQEEAACAAGELGELMKLLSNPDRILIVEALSANRAMSVNDVAEQVGIPATRASQHLNLLRAYRLVSRKIQGRRRFYSLRSSDLAPWLRLGSSLLATSGFSQKR